MNPFSSITRRHALLLAAALGASTLLSGCYVEESHVHHRVYHDPYAGGGYYHDRGYYGHTTYERRGDYHRDVYVSGSSYHPSRTVYAERHTYPVKHHRTTTVVTPEVTVRHY